MPSSFAVFFLPFKSQPYLSICRSDDVRFDIQNRMFDFGLHFWTSHHPYLVPSPFTLEPTESYSKAELEEYCSVLEHIAHEARETPDIVKTAPHNSVCHKIDYSVLDRPEDWCITWRSYLKKANLKG